MHVLANALCALCGTFMLTKKTVLNRSSNTFFTQQRMR